MFLNSVAAALRTCFSLPITLGRCAQSKNGAKLKNRRTAYTTQTPQNTYHIGLAVSTKTHQTCTFFLSLVQVP